jgi:diguanylate cyclase (GGDEF)-like protein/PAS domain S-box-containing protein
VDDDPDFGEIIETYLKYSEIWQFEITQVSSAKEALEKMTEDVFDMHLVDIFLKNDNGLELLKQAIASGVKTPIIVTSGQNHLEVEEEAFKLGAADYVGKAEISPRVLDRIFRAALFHKASEIELLSQKIALEKGNESLSLYSANLKDQIEVNKKIEDQLVKQKEEYRQLMEKYRAIFDNMREGIYQRRVDGSVITANAAMARIFGYETVEELIEGYNSSSQVVRFLPHERKRFIAILEKDGYVNDFETTSFKKDGSTIWIRVSSRIVKDEAGNTQYLEGMIVDITAVKEAENKLLHFAFHDPLTGLPNRSQLVARLDGRLQKSKIDNDWNFAVLNLNLDNFKIINESYGHGAGDQFLQTIAERLNHVKGKSDFLARLASDEFAILIDQVGGTLEINAYVEKIQKALQLSIPSATTVINPSASIGVAMYQPQYKQGLDMLRDAGTAMSSAKKRGRNFFQIFNPALHYQAVEKLDLENQLRQALEKKEFELHYQPIYGVSQSSIIGFESLVRWNHPKRGLLSPAHFIDLAEETGLIVPLGSWILNEVFRQHKKWAKNGHERMFASINLSVKQLQDQFLISMIKRLMEETAMPEDLIKLEITESMALDRSEEIYKSLNSFSDMAVALSIDDFGTGFSSLGNLKKYRFKSLKIDKSFIDGVPQNKQDCAMVKGIISLAQSLNLQIIAEGVETIEQYDFLKESQCDAIQGYYYSRPVTAEAFETLLIKDSQPRPFSSN